MQVHAIIPHHHHSSESELLAHHSSDHQHDESEEGGNNLNDIFSHFVHSADSFTFTHVDNTNNTLSKKQFIIVAILSTHFSFTDYITPPIRNKSSIAYLISAHSLSSGLRAPPIFIA